MTSSDDPLLSSDFSVSTEGLVTPTAGVLGEQKLGVGSWKSYVVYALIGVVVVGLIIVVITSVKAAPKKQKGLARARAPANTETTVKKTGYYLGIGGGGYLTAKERIFPTSDTNASVLLHRSPTAETLWEVRGDKSNKFRLFTKVNGVNYSLQDGAPGAGASWGVAYIAPTSVRSRIGKADVMMKLQKGCVVSVKPVWGKSLNTLRMNNNVAVWGEEGGEQIKLIKA